MALHLSSVIAPRGARDCRLERAELSLSDAGPFPRPSFSGDRTVVFHALSKNAPAGSRRQIRRGTVVTGVLSGTARASEVLPAAKAVAPLRAMQPRQVDRGTGWLALRHFAAKAPVTHAAANIATMPKAHQPAA